MSEIAFRAAAFSAGENRLVRGIVVPYGLTLDGHRFEPGSFAQSIQERGNKIRLFVGDRSRPIGRAVQLQESQHGLLGVFDIDPGPAGEEFLCRLRAGGGQLEARVRPVKERTEGDTAVCTEAALIDFRDRGRPDDRHAPTGPVIPRAVAERRLRLLELT